MLPPPLGVRELSQLQKRSPFIELDKILEFT
jgi:hypothetical protein